MSLRAPSLIGLLGILQQHGLTYPLLSAFVQACQAQHSGPIIFQVAQGRIRSVEVHLSVRQQRVLQHD